MAGTVELSETSILKHTEYKTATESKWKGK
jgi:hypothetical protein